MVLFLGSPSLAEGGLTLFLENKLLTQEVSLVSANDTITLHHLCVTPGVEPLICWLWLLLRAAAEGQAHLLSCGRALTQRGWAPASELTLVKDGEDVWLRYSCNCKMTPLARIPFQKPVSGKVMSGYLADYHSVAWNKQFGINLHGFVWCKLWNSDPGMEINTPEVR